LATFGVLLYLLIGSILYPEWWYGFAFKGKILSPRYWANGFSYLGRYYALPTLGLVIVVVCVFIALPRAQRINRAKQLLRTATLAFHGVNGAILIGLLGSLLIVSFASMPDREVREAKMLSSIEGDVRQYLDTLKAKLEPQKPPLSQPTSFIYLSNETVTSLYSQYEDELVPSKVVEEQSNSNSAKAGVSVQQVVSGELSKSDLQKKTAEYRETQRSPERKLKELLAYLYKSGTLRRFGDFKSDSSDVKSLDDATNVLQSHAISIDRSALRRVRDRIMGEELTRLRADLRSTRGLFLIEGDWRVTTTNEAYVLTRPFVSDVTDSPVCEVKFPKVTLKPQTREVLDSLRTEPLRLAIFGNVLVGISDSSSAVRLDPVAAY